MSARPSLPSPPPVVHGGLRSAACVYVAVNGMRPRGGNASRLQRPHSCTRLPRQSARLATPPRPPAPSPWASSAARHPPRLQRESAMARPHSGMVCCDGRWYAPVQRRCLEAMGPSVAPLAPLLAGVGVSIRLWQMPPPGLHIIYAPALRTCGVQSRQMVPSPRGDVPPSR